MPRVRFLQVLLLGAAIASGAGEAAAQTASRSAPPAHRLVVQVTQNDPALMTMVLNNVENATRYFEEKGETVQVELVAFGAGLAMLRADTSPVKTRLSSLARSQKSLVLSGCGNTMANQGKAESQEITLVPEARIVPAGIARVVELQEQGWIYIRP